MNRMKAYINIEDTDDGHVAVNYVFLEGLTGTSRAHHLCALVKTHLDDIMQEQQPVVEETIRERGAVLVAPTPRRIVVPS